MYNHRLKKVLNLPYLLDSINMHVRLKYNFFLLVYFIHIDTYEEGIELLKKAEDTSNIDDSALSDEEAEAQRRKRKRRINAQKQLSSDDEQSLAKKSPAKKRANKLTPVPALSQFVRNKINDSDTSDVNLNEASTSFRNEKEINKGTLYYFFP